MVALVVAAVAAVVVVAAAVDKENKMTHIKTTHRISMLTRLTSFAAAFRGLALALLLSVPLLAVAAEQKTFATPDAAVSALIEAFKAAHEVLKAEGALDEK